MENVALTISMISILAMPVLLISLCLPGARGRRARRLKALAGCAGMFVISLLLVGAFEHVGNGGSAATQPSDLRISTAFALVGFIAFVSYRLGFDRGRRFGTARGEAEQSASVRLEALPVLNSVVADASPVRQGTVARLSDDHDLGPAIAKGAPGATRSFEYADAHGEVTERTIVNWIEYEYYMRGVCTMRHATRTFRKDRILAEVDPVEAPVR